MKAFFNDASFIAPFVCIAFPCERASALLNMLDRPVKCAKTATLIPQAEGSSLKVGSPSKDDLRIKGQYRELSPVQHVIRFINRLSPHHDRHYMVRHYFICPYSPETCLCSSRTSKG